MCAYHNTAPVLSKGIRGIPVMQHGISAARSAARYDNIPRVHRDRGECDSEGVVVNAHGGVVAVEIGGSIQAGVEQTQIRGTITLKT